MCRVKPDKIREPGRYPFNWIVDDNYNCLRPYRILIKESQIFYLKVYFMKIIII